MDAAEHTAFRNRLVGLAEVFDVKLSPQRTALYFEALRDLPLERVVIAMNQTLQTAKFFPRPAEIRALAVGDSETAEEAAWMAFRAAMKTIGSYSSVSFDDAALGETVMAMFGSWPAACVAEFSSEMWAAKRKEFGRVYRVCAGRKLDGARYLPGLCEQANGGREDWKKFVPLGRIGRDGEVQQLPPATVEPARVAIAATAHEFSQLRDLVNLRLVPKSMDETA